MYHFQSLNEASSNQGAQQRYTHLLEYDKSFLITVESVYVSFSLSLSDSIGCGLDRLAWDKVSVILEQVFKHTNISITVYSLPEKTETKVMKENMRR